MKLSITGGTPEKQSLCHSFAHHAMKDICGTRLYNLLDINIVLDDTLATEFGHLGNCAATDGLVLPREFEIEIASNLQNRHLLVILGHEIVHAKQYAKGELKELISGIMKWKGDEISRPSTQAAYNRLPWEIEARGLEEILFVEWAEKNKITHNWVMLDLYEH